MSAADLENTCPPLAAGAAYPCWRNDGSGVGFETGSELVSDPSQAKIVWKSEELVPCGYHEGINLGTRPCGVQTGHASPVLAEDRVFMSWFVGSPGREADDRKGFDDFLPTSLHVPPEMIAKKIARVADQIVTCMDARTGRTLWRAVVKEGGPNISRGGSDSRHKLFGPSSKAASHLTPCAAYGKVFAKGTGNILYAFDAATGKLLWQTGEFDPRAKFWGSGTDSVTFADGVVATGLGELSGFDHGSGRKLWGVKGATGGRGETHIRWVCKGKEFFIAPKGQCLEPKTGKVLWTAEGAPGGVIAADESRLVFGHSGSIVAYRVSPQGAEKLWSTTDHLVWRTITPVVYRGAAFVRAVTPAGAARSQAATYCFDVETGMVLGQATGTKSFSSVVAGDGRIFNCNAALVIMQTADPKDFRDLKATGNAPSNTVADVSMPIVIQGQPETTAIYADGRIFTRCFDGVICMDLRAAPAHDGRKGTAPTPGRR
jgi:outer membrane protein assembly factor BamB